MILIIALLIIRILQSSIKPEPFILSARQKQEIESFINSFEKSPELSRDEPSLSTDTNHSPENYNFTIFDPNKADKEELLKMGLSNFVVNNIISYRRAGGSFVRPEDMMRIYGMEEKVYNKLEPYVNVAALDSAKIIMPENKPDKELNKDVIRKIFINRASFADLMKIPELTPRIAGRIINYRELLGGYYSYDQLDEVYGMTDSLRIHIMDYLFIDLENITELSIKEIDFATMLRHPYLEKEHVKNFFELKDFYGDSIKLKHIKDNRIFPDSIFDRMEPYFPG